MSAVDDRRLHLNSWAASCRERSGKYSRGAGTPAAKVVSASEARRDSRAMSPSPLRPSCSTYRSCLDRTASARRCSLGRDRKCNRKTRGWRPVACKRDRRLVRVQSGVKRLVWQGHSPVAVKQYQPGRVAPRCHADCTNCIVLIAQWRAWGVARSSVSRLAAVLRTVASASPTRSCCAGPAPSRRRAGGCRRRGTSASTTARWRGRSTTRRSHG